MATPFNIAQPDSTADAAAAPELLALQASPSVVAHAERMHHAFLETLRLKLESALGTATETAFIRMEQSFLSRCVTEAEPGMHDVLLSLAPLAGYAVLRVSQELLFKVLDILLASPAAATGERGETVTAIELHVLRGFFKTFSEALSETWKSVPQVALTLAPERSEDVLAAYRESHVLAIKSRLEIDGVSGAFDVVLPAFVARLSAQLLEPDRGEAPSRRIAAALGAARLDIDAVLSNLTIRLGDLAELKTGQILLAKNTADSTFECLVNKKSQFNGELVPAGDRYGFQLIELEKEAESPLDR
jgi:flagellar motor switch protein FliM